MTIEAFIKARLDEDDEIATAAAGASAARWVADEDEVYAVFGSLTDPDRCEDHAPGRPNMCEDNRVASADDCSDQWLDERARHIARHDPARVLRHVTAIRATVKAAGEIGNECGDPHKSEAYALMILAPIATAWSDHPDYRPEWAA